ncbi:hypothetical protein B0H16DRAFT_874698 [Mycena metata]|uniref:Uncharacterized protein n=1 Tax=Mycena metata TaxID=1033252 RepID=A0AAD7N897_9AGAR|nr:hypothetical protein B0H16DRAFT_874698 [Mycena metata]
MPERRTMGGVQPRSRIVPPPPEFCTGHKAPGGAVPPYAPVATSYTGIHSYDASCPFSCFDTEERAVGLFWPVLKLCVIAVAADGGSRFRAGIRGVRVLLRGVALAHGCRHSPNGVRLLRTTAAIVGHALNGACIGTACGISPQDGYTISIELLHFWLLCFASGLVPRLGVVLLPYQNLRATLVPAPPKLGLESQVLESQSRWHSCLRSEPRSTVSLYYILLSFHLAGSSFAPSDSLLAFIRYSI